MGGSSADAWRSNQKALRTLADLGLVETPTDETVSLHPAIRTWLYQQLPLDRRAELHLAAAAHHAERSRFTMAAHHYIQAGRPEIALWTWYNHRQQESSKEGGAALEMFIPLMQTALPDLEDQRVLALLMAQLCSPAGRTQEGLAALAGVTWSQASLGSAQAHQLRAELLTDVGEIDQALAEYRHSLESVRNLRSTQEINLRTHIGRRALWYLHDLPQARHEVAQARLISNCFKVISKIRLATMRLRALITPMRLPRLCRAPPTTSAPSCTRCWASSSRYAHLELAVEHIQGWSLLPGGR